MLIGWNGFCIPVGDFELSVLRSGKEEEKEEMVSVGSGGPTGKGQKGY